MNEEARQAQKSIIQESVEVLSNIFAFIAAVLACMQIYDYTFVPVALFFIERWQDNSLGQLASYAYVGLATLVVFHISRIFIVVALFLIAEAILVRFVLAV